MVYANSRMAEMLGYTIDELIGRLNSDFRDDGDHQENCCQLAHGCTGLKEQYDFRFCHRDESTVWTSVTETPTLDEDGGYTGSLIMVSDMTEQRQLNARLHQMEADLARRPENQGGSQVPRVPSRVSVGSST